MHATPGSTLGEIVSGDYRAAAVFQKYGIDYCCGGARTIKAACDDRQLDVTAVLGEVALECASRDDAAPRFSEWTPTALVDHIVSTHHVYVRQALPAIAAGTRKIAQVHGANHPQLFAVERLFANVAAEMSSHMMKEEQILFPFIVRLDDAAQSGGPAPAIPFGTVANPIHMMEAEHESAGSAMAQIRQLTADYTVPPDGCATYRVTLEQLRAFEQDLHAHVHIENNILFPKALALETGLR